MHCLTTNAKRPARIHMIRVGDGDYLLVYGDGRHAGKLCKSGQRWQAIRACGRKAGEAPSRDKARTKLNTPCPKCGG